MKKRILAILLSALLVANVSACNYISTDNEQEETTNESSIMKYSSTNEDHKGNNSNNDVGSIQAPTYKTHDLIDILQLSNVFASVLKNETRVLDSKDNSLAYLNDFIIGSMTYAYVSALDLDKSCVNDLLVLECSDKVIVLKEHKGTVYAWQYRHTALYNLLVDGTYSWSEQAGNIYGTDKLQFNGATKDAVELDRVEYNEKFYINEIEVSKDTFQAYIQNKNSAEKANRYLWETGFESSYYQENGK